MARKIIPMITLVTFILINLNCYTSKELSSSETLKKLSPSERNHLKSMKIFGIVTKTGDTLQFPLDNPAVFARDTVDTIGGEQDKYVTTIKDTIVGITIDSVHLSIPVPDVDKIQVKIITKEAKIGITKIVLIGMTTIIAFFIIAVNMGVL